MGRPIQKKDLSCRRIENETIIIDLNDKKMFHKLNETAGFIWNLCDGKNSLEEITSKVCEEFETQDSTAQADVKVLLEQFIENDLIQYV